MMTGYYPHENGVMGLAHMGWALGDDWDTLPKLLRAAGYDTALLGFQHEVPDEPERLGYEHVDSGMKRASELVDIVDDFLTERADAADPFFVSIGIEEPHRPFRRDYLPEGTYDRYDPDEVPLDDFPYLPNAPGVREDVADLRSVISEVLDPAVGRYRESLADAGLAEETVFVFTTDHGLAIPRAKGTCYDPGIETVLLVHQPGVVEGGAVHDDLVTNVDFTPTMLDLLGVEPPTAVSGKSFAPLLRGEPHEDRDRIFAEMTWHDRYNPIRAIRTERYKYVRNFTRYAEVYIPGDVLAGAPGQAVAEEYVGGGGTTRPREELYDLQEDPHERENLVSDPLFERGTDAQVPYEYEHTLEDLRTRLDSWLEATDDPILEGEVPAPNLDR